jgi:uncharacterized protein YuzE
MIHKKYDQKVDAFYISCRKGKVAKTENKGDYLVDYDSQKRVLGYEILNYSVVAGKLGSIDGILLESPCEPRTKVCGRGSSCEKIGAGNLNAKLGLSKFSK